MKKIFLLILIAIALTPLASKAQEYTLLEPLPCIAGTSTDDTCNADNTTKTINLNDYIGYVFKFSIALAAFLAVIMIIFGGFQYMTSETPFGKGDGKEKIWNAVTGLLMVLASYLILATIDPRLVEINTKIDPIVIDTSDSQEFRGKLASDLRALSAETQAKTNGFVATRTALQKELAELDKDLAERQQDLGAEEEEELLTRRAQLQQQIRAVSTEISKSVATTIGQSSYSFALSALADPTNYSQNNLVQYTAEQISNQKVNGVYLTDSPNIIQRNYNTKMNEVLKNSDKDEAEKAAEIQILEKQRDFYITQIAEDVSLNSWTKPLTDDSWYSFLKWSPSVKNDAIKKLNDNLKYYQQNLADPKKPTEAGVPDAEYKKIIQAKIDLITKTLGSNQQ